jgi:SHS2 domain-containing protein
MARHPDFEILEHTADAGIIAYGASLEEVFSHAAEGMYSLMVDLGDVREAESRDIESEAKGLANLISSWLVELLFLTETESLVFRRFELDIQGNTLHGQAFGEHIDPSRHKVGGVVKGVTRHLLEVSQTADGYRARVLFDM